MSLLHITHTQLWDTLTFLSRCWCGNSHFKPRCSSSCPRGAPRPVNLAMWANGIYFSPMSCAANRQATVTVSVVSGERVHAVCQDTEIAFKKCRIVCNQAVKWRERLSKSVHSETFCERLAVCGLFFCNIMNKKQKKNSLFLSFSNHPLLLYISVPWYFSLVLLRAAHN